MTLPDERYRAIKYARAFLRSLLNPRLTPKVPKLIRQHACRVLRHYPGEFDMRVLAERCPGILQGDKAAELFPHYWICATCAAEKGGVWPEGHCATVGDIECKYCNDKNRAKGEASAPYVDYDWPNLKTSHLRD